MTKQIISDKNWLNKFNLKNIEIENLLYMKQKLCNTDSMSKFYICIGEAYIFELFHFMLCSSMRVWCLLWRNLNESLNLFYKLTMNYSCSLLWWWLGCI